MENLIDIFNSYFDMNLLKEDQTNNVKFTSLD